MIRAGLAVLAILFFAGVAWGANQPHPTLDAAASSVAGKPLTVYCETDEPAWFALLDSFGTGRTTGFTILEEPVVYVSPVICLPLHLALTRLPTGAEPQAFARALLILAHESVHQRGVRDEGATDCTALIEIQRLAVTYFGYPPTVTVPTVKLVPKWVWRLVNGKKVRRKILVKKIVQVVKPNPRLGQLQELAYAAHLAKGPNYAGLC